MSSNYGSNAVTEHSTDRQRGFTLVEMAIVLVIIGLILAAISIGKDAERNAEYKNVAQGFVQPWVQAYNAYYDRVQVPVGDNLQNATQRVGGCVAYNPADCAFGSAPTTATTPVLVNLMTQTGISMPQGLGGTTQGHQQQFRYLDQAGVAHTLTLWFAYNGDGSPPNGNVMVLQDVVPELASMLDGYVDGSVNLASGNFACGSVDATSGKFTAQNISVDADETASKGYDCVWKMAN